MEGEKGGFDGEDWRPGGGESIEADGTLAAKSMLAKEVDRSVVSLGCSPFDC